MNAFLLGAAALGTLAAMYASPMASAPSGMAPDMTPDRGEMIRQTQVNPQTGQTTEISIIGFED